MNFFSNMRISHKISALMVALIFGFIVIGVTYYIQVRIENTSLSAEQETLQFRSQLAEINMAVAELTTAGSTYLQEPSEAAQQAVEKQLEATHGILQTHINSSNNSAATNQLTALLTQLQQYQNQFKQLAAQHQTLGYTEQSGMRQKIAQNANSINALLIQFNQPELMILAKSIAADSNSSNSAKLEFEKLITETKIPNVGQERLNQVFEQYATNIIALQNARQSVNTSSKTWREQQNQLSSAAAKTIAASYSQASGSIESNIEQRKIVQAVVTAIIFAVAMGTAVGVYFLYKSIVFPLVHMQSVIRKINRGKTNTRVKVLTHDELGDLGTAFNQLLDERINQLEARSLENDQLNNSIISLIRALGVIAQKDLTIKVPVSADITGTISDAVNLLTTETAKTLQDVKSISEEVNGISERLQEQSHRVMEYADGEKRQIHAAAKALEMLARAMNDVAKNAEHASANASKAIESTQQARHSVEETVGGIRAIRETISETEKRTKRLGDRSQEISGIVNLINTIAERTHILALNASMHAASAGEAGRGFAVVADEVQRLAESARQSTDEIAAMVNNMRVETSDTVAIMSKLISQVAEGSHLAELAGKRMADTEAATVALATDVKTISQQAVQQAEIANRVRDRSGIIRKFSDKTGQQLQEQKHQTDSLKEFADTLVRHVNVFTLPESMRPSVAATRPKDAEDIKAVDDTEDQHVDEPINRLQAAG